MVASCSLLMRVKPDAPPPDFATGVPAMFEALLDVFAPLDVTIEIDDEQHRVARLDPVRVFATEPLWCDEELTRDALTRCPPTLGTDVVAELHDRLAGITTPATFHVSAKGAVHHRIDGTDEPAWYGRWRGTGLTDLVTIRFHWAKLVRCFELESFGGYPFAPLRALVTRLAPGDDAIAAQNRALWLAALANVRAALGFDREEVEWKVEGNGAEIRKDWLARLR